MSLGAGDRLGPYEIRGPLGAGGMGEVYQARDTRLGRDVAIKIASAEFSERFEREARAIAALNHPNICALYDVGPNYLVMELVPGQTLADVIAAAGRDSGKGLPLAEVVVIGRQIADALEAAHEKGIVHRDLKPANVKITPDGAVKVLDFGLAKSLDAGPAASPDDDSPTVLSPARTERGMILGTARYMAPEQARGRPVDRRADIWAFGVVLFEMLTGRPLFPGDTATEIIASVIKDDIALSRLPPDTSPAIRQLIARCLERDPRMRLRDIGEARIALADPTATAAVVPAPAAPSTESMHGATTVAASRAPWLAWAALTLLLAAAAGAAAWLLKPAAGAPLRRIELADPLASAASAALSPDGSRIAYIAAARLYVRTLDALVPHDLGAVHVTSRFVTWSPDGRTIGFSGGGAIYTVPADGGSLRQICAVPASGQLLDLAWSQAGALVFSVQRDSIYTVPVAGGKPEIYLAIDPGSEVEFNSVSPLSDDRLIVTTRLRKPAAFRTEIVGGPDSHRQRTTLIDDPDVMFVRHDPQGALLFRRRGPNNGIWAVPFDGSRVDLSSAVEVAPRGTSVQSDAGGTALVSLPPPPATAELVWMTLKGDVAPVPGARFAPGSQPTLSRDGTRVALIVDAEGDRHLVVRDLQSGGDLRLTPAGDAAPTLDPPEWSPSGDEVIFTTGPATTPQIVARRTDGSGGRRTLVAGRAGQVTADGRYLVFLVDDPGGSRLRYAALSADGTAGAPQRLFAAADPVVPLFDLSHDGLTMAYSVREADGRLNAFLTDVPAARRQVQVTTRGAGGPRLAPDGRTLFYLTRAEPDDPPRGALATRPVALPALQVSGAPVQLIAEGDEPPGVMFTMFDLSKDGRLLTLRRIGGGQPPAPRLLLVQNWRAVLTR